MPLEWLGWGVDDCLLAAGQPWLAGGVIIAVGRNQPQYDRNHPNVRRTLRTARTSNGSNNSNTAGRGEGCGFDYHGSNVYLIA